MSKKSRPWTRQQRARIRERTLGTLRQGYTRAGWPAYHISGYLADGPSKADPTP